MPPTQTLPRRPLTVPEMERVIRLTEQSFPDFKARREESKIAKIKMTYWLMQQEWHLIFPTEEAIAKAIGEVLKESK